MFWKSALGTEVVDTSTAEKIGSLDGFVVDPSSAAIAAIIVGDRLVTWEDAGGIGPDAVTIQGEDLLRLPRSSVEERALAGDTDPIGRRVLTDRGFALGPVADIEFDEESGAVLGLTVGDETLAGDRLLGVGSYAVVVADAD